MAQEQQEQEIIGGKKPVTQNNEITRGQFLRIMGFGVGSVVLTAMFGGRTTAAELEGSFPEFIGPDQGFVTPHIRPIQISAVGLSLDFRREANASTEEFVSGLKENDAYMNVSNDGVLAAQLLRADGDVFDKLANELVVEGSPKALDYKRWKEVLGKASRGALARWNEIENGPQYYDITGKLQYGAKLKLNYSWAELRGNGVSEREILAVTPAQWDIPQPNNNGRVLGVRNEGSGRMYYMFTEVGKVFPTSPDSENFDTRFCPRGAMVGYWNNAWDIKDTNFVQIAEWV